jgi:uncharacterized RDD family membrane protein YckC
VGERKGTGKPDGPRVEIRREDVAGWLENPGGRRREPGEYPGGRLGLPEHGRGSAAGFARRLAAIAVDWLACLVIAAAFSDDRWLPLGIFAVQSVLLLCTLGATFGMRLLGLQVVRLGQPGHLLAPWRAVVRTTLLCVVIPAAIWDRDGRGLHDKAVGTVVVRAR